MICEVCWPEVFIVTVTCLYCMEPFAFAVVFYTAILFELVINAQGFFFPFMYPKAENCLNANRHFDVQVCYGYLYGYSQSLINLQKARCLFIKVKLPRHCLDVLGYLRHLHALSCCLAGLSRQV